MGRTLAWSAARAAGQLTLAALLLDALFHARHPALTACLLVVMTGLGARAAVARVRLGHRGLGWIGALSLALGTWVTGALGVGLLAGGEDWSSPRFLVPFIGLLLGNSLSGIALGIDHWTQTLSTGADRVELYLAWGATRWEAARESFRAALHTGMTPMVNALAVAGVVSLPGMMVGQLMAGVEPMKAARYQIAMLFLITAATGVGTVTAVFLSYRRLFDGRHRFHPERLVAGGAR